MILKIAQFLRRMHREDKGFTLIELLIVIAILGVLAAMALPLIANRIGEAREAADRANVRMLQGLVELYFLDCNVYPTLVAHMMAATGVEGYQGPYLKDPEVAPPLGYSPYTISNGVVRSTEDGKLP